MLLISLTQHQLLLAFRSDGDKAAFADHKRSLGYRSIQRQRLVHGFDSLLSNILDNYSCSSVLKAVSGRVLDHSQHYCDLPDVFNNNCNRLHHLLQRCLQPQLAATTVQPQRRLPKFSS